MPTKERVLTNVCFNDCLYINLYFDVINKSIHNLSGRLKIVDLI